MRSFENRTMSLRSLTAATLASMALLAGCRIEKPATVIPPPPAIESFTASARSAARDGKVTLSWTTSEATSIELREASTGALGAPGDQLSGSLEVTITADALFVLTARGPGGTDARALSVTLEDSTVGAITFQAIPQSIPVGAQTTLVWNAPGATAVTLAEGTQALDLAGQRSSGALTVSPAFDTSYTFTADGQARTVTVLVQPGVLTLEAAPRAVEAGDPVTLSWTAGGAEHLIITSPGRGQLADITDPARIRAGSFEDVVPQLPPGGLVTYEVAAVKGAERLSRQVEVNVGTGLAITRFDAPPVAGVGGSYSVRWETRAADQVELQVDGITVHRTASQATAAVGLFAFTAPAADFAVELIATNALGGRVTQLAQVDSVGVPTVITLTASPTTVTAGSPVTLTWASQEARRVRITDADGETLFSVTGQRAEGGTAVVYPNADTTYTVSADNLLGSTAITATAAVTVTGTPLTMSQFPPTAISGQNVQLTASQTGALYYGFPHALVLRSTQADFIDISATGTRVLESGGAGFTTVELPFTTWLWGSKRTGSLTISRAGWMAWGAPLVVNSSETSLPSTSTSAAPGLIAPFWDNLTLTANSAIFAQLVGNAPDQSLVVQWDRLQVGTSTNTEVTFQARVHQNGVVSFHYLTMTLSSPTYSFFTAGIQDETRTLGLEVDETPTSNSAVYFFSPVTALDVRVTKGSSWSGFVQVGNVRTRVGGAALAVELPQDLALTELMFRPNEALPNGQWIEVLNRTAGPLDLTGWQLRSPSSPTFAVASGYSLPPGVPTLIGASTDPLQNDDAGVSVSWSPFTLSPDAGELTLGTADAGVTVTYSGPADGGTGASKEFDSNTYRVRSGSPSTLTCEPTRTFGSQTPLQRGSPGSLTSCFPYTVQAIPVQYVDISATGTRLLNNTTTATSTVVPITLAATGADPAPVAFGVRRPVLSMSLSGWIAWGSTTTTSGTNKTIPTSSNPLGTLAPFWDFLQVPASTPASMYWKRFAPNEDPVTTAQHWVFMWHQVRHVTGDELNFQVKLFEDGTIEYHYGAMVSGSSSNYADGNSATVWLEEPTGFTALTQSVNQPVVAPNTAWRFIPQ